MKQPPWLIPTASAPLRNNSQRKPNCVRPHHEFIRSLVVIGWRHS